MITHFISQKMGDFHTICCTLVKLIFPNSHPSQLSLIRIKKRVNVVISEVSSYFVTKIGVEVERYCVLTQE